MTACQISAGAELYLIGFLVSAAILMIVEENTTKGPELTNSMIFWSSIFSWFTVLWLSVLVIWACWLVCWKGRR